MNKCPSCGKSLIGGLIFDTFLEQHNGDRVAALKDAQGYGATETEGRWELAIGITDLFKDRIVAYQCPFCNKEWDRFTGKIL